MGSDLLAVMMSRSFLLCLVLGVTILAWHTVQGTYNPEGEEGIEEVSSNVLNQADGDILRNVRSAERKKKRNKKKTGKKIKRTKNKGQKKAKGKKDNGRARKTKNKSKLKKQLRKFRNKKNKGNVKKSKRKNKDKKRKAKKRKTKGQKRNSKQSSVSCPSSAVNSACLENAMLSLAYEKNQVTNYIKQAKRLDNHQNISSNKLTKKDEFESAAKHMLWAIGGNLSDPKCGQDTNDTKRRAQQTRDLKSSIANYNKLKNCSATIKEACDMSLQSDSYNHSDHSENMTLCRTYKADFINVSKECQSTKDQANATLQCDCWARAAKDVLEIKKLKCETSSKQKFVTQHKNICIKAFGACKRMEDDAIDLIHKCVHDHANKFIGQTQEWLQAAAVAAGSVAFRRRLAELGISV